MLLFDMEKNAVESTNVSGEHPEVATELKKLLAEYINNGRSTPGVPARERYNAQPADGRRAGEGG